MIGFVIAAPFAAALAALPLRNAVRRRWTRIVSALIAALLPSALIGTVDGLSLVFTALVSCLGLLATLFSIGSFADDFGNGAAGWSRKAVYFVLLGAFWSAMLLVVLANNFALLWLGISATTLATAFLVGFSGEAAALEAAWKYLVLCSVGIAFALLGLVVLAHVSAAAGLAPTEALSWTAIAAHGWTSVPTPARLATALMIVGFGTKAGLVPMHAWLPDAHSKAPAPISGLLSGVLVSCALYAIMRTVGTSAALGVAPFLQDLLTWFGALSALVAGTLMLTQRDLKRLLAYSTVEHAGIVALALGFGGPLGWFAALFHVVSHAFAKSAAFFAAGMVQHERRTTMIVDLHGLWSVGHAGRFVLGALTALSGMPPFGLFVSESLLVVAGVAAHRWLPLGFGLLGMALAFAALSRTAIEIESGRGAHAEARRASSAAPPVGPLRSWLISGAAACALAGAFALVVVPWTRLGAALQAIASTIGGVR